MINPLNRLSKLVIGTAQYGMNYGVANKKGKISDDQMKKILDLAFENDIKTIDTAINYGNCEEKLGFLCVNNFDLISKISNLQDIKGNIKDLTIKNVEKSVKDLKIQNLNTLLLHSSSDLLSEKNMKFSMLFVIVKILDYVKKLVFQLIMQTK